MSKGQPKKPKPWRSAPGIYALNQHAPRYADRRTKRNRSRSDRERRALAEQSR